jgi:hypothetical protein
MESSGSSSSVVSDSKCTVSHARHVCSQDAVTICSPNGFASTATLCWSSGRPQRDENGRSGVGSSSHRVTRRGEGNIQGHQGKRKLWLIFTVNTLYDERDGVGKISHLCSSRISAAESCTCLGYAVRRHQCLSSTIATALTCCPLSPVHAIANRRGAGKCGNADGASFAPAVVAMMAAVVSAVWRLRLIACTNGAGGCGGDGGGGH